MHALEHRGVFTQAVDQSVIALEGRKRDVDLLVVIGALVYQYQPHPRVSRSLAHELIPLSLAISGIDAKKISMMMIAEATQY